MHSTLRVNQLDALRLDAELCTLLRDHLNNAWSASLLSDRLSEAQPWLEALLQLLVWRYTIWLDLPTPGGRLQNVKYVSHSGRQQSMSGIQKVLLLAARVLPILVPQAWRAWLRARQDEAEDGLRTVVLRVLRSAEVLWRLGSMLNFIAFLRLGTYPTIADRLLRVRLVHVSPEAHRQTSYQYMNRVMMWNGFSEFLLTVAPLVDLSRLQRKVTKQLLPSWWQQTQAATGPQTMCNICGSSPMTLPMTADCGHAFCYFCIASEQMESANRGASCPTCGAVITSFRHAF
mmetsp:Transcript_9394/g.17014  ORF Transcript_9394/g.17014 Transcript_9394/m.17014 type:complete len:288 (+) Transcript_9394:21-884(+)